MSISNHWLPAARTVLFVGTVYLAPVMWGQNSPTGNYVSFQAFGSSDTSPTAINAALTVAGTYFAGNLAHGFLRDVSGNFTSFDIPGASAKSLSVAGLTDAGVIAGSYSTDNRSYHGFVRSPDGAITTFDAPAAFETLENGLDQLGVSVGADVTTDGPGPIYGFIRSPDGTITTLNYSPVTGFPMTRAQAINIAGTTVGWYSVEGGLISFVRAADGTVQSFTVPGASETFADSINASGTIAGTYVLGSASTMTGFLLNPDGSFTYFSPPIGTITHLAKINAAGAVIGTFRNSANFCPPDQTTCLPYMGFLRSSSGTISVIQPPGYGCTQGLTCGTFPGDISNSGVITGSYTDAAGKVVGFLRFP